MIYHGGKRYGLSEEAQSLIYWKCRNYYKLPERERKTILKIAKECGKGAEKALFEMVTTGRSLTAVAMKHYISESALQERCAAFYREAAERL